MAKDVIKEAPREALAEDKNFSVKVTLVKPSQTEASAVRPKLGRLPVMSSTDNEQIQAIAAEVSEQDRNVSASRLRDFRFTLFLVILFAGVNLGLMALLHKKHAASPPAAITLQSVEEPKIILPPTESAGVQQPVKPALAPAVELRKPVIAIDQAVSAPVNVPTASTPVVSPRPPAVPTPSPAAASQELLSIINKD